MDKVVARNRVWRAENPAKKKEQARRYRDKHSKELYEKSRAYFSSNKEKWLNYRANYVRNRRLTDPIFKMRIYLSRTLNGKLRSHLAGKKSIKTMALLGCSLAEFKTHIERKFHRGMDWTNWGRGSDKWHIDHIRPCASFDLSDIEQQKTCFHYTNMQPLWEHDNLTKHSRWVTT